MQGDDDQRQNADSVNSTLKWLSTLFSKPVLSILTILVVLTILGCAALVSYKYIDTEIYTKSLEIQDKQLEVIKDLLDVHERMQRINISTLKRQVAELEKLIVVQDLILRPNTSN